MGLQVPVDMLFTGNDWNRPRWTVEREKMRRRFRHMEFHGSSEEVKSVQGTLETSYYNSYYVRIEVPSSYPYAIPKVWLPHDTIDTDCGHVYPGGSICTLHPNQWSKTMSLAVIVAKTAVWLNKYDSWVRKGKGRWPGKDQHR